MTTSTTYRLKESPTGLEPASTWKRPEFQRFTGIILGTALLLSLICAFNLSSDVRVVTDQHAPYINSRLSDLEINNPYLYYPYLY